MAYFDTSLDVRERMFDYYPQVIKTIQEFKAITDSDGSEFNGLQTEFNSVLDDAYLTTMGEDRITLWENLLGIAPLNNSSIDDRRETVIARIRGQGKLNSTLVNAIVNAFTGGTANSWVKDSTLYVEITPPPNNKQFQFANVEKELKNKVPAHLDVNVYRNYFTWGELKDTVETWQDVENFGTWMDIYLYVPPNAT